LDQSLKILQNVKGFGSLIGRRGLRSNDWEEMEHAFAVAKEAVKVKRKNLALELFPTIIIMDEEKIPDMRISTEWGDILLRSQNVINVSRREGISEVRR